MIKNMPPLPKKKPAAFHHPLGFALYDAMAMDLYAMSYAEQILIELDALRKENERLKKSGVNAKDVIEKQQFDSWVVVGAKAVSSCHGDCTIMRVDRVRKSIGVHFDRNRRDNLVDCWYIDERGDGRGYTSGKGIDELMPKKTLADKYSNQLYDDDDYSGDDMMGASG